MADPSSEGAGNGGGESSLTLPISVRSARASDLPFIENAWRATMLSTCPGVSGADPGHFHGEMTRVFGRLLPDAVVRVAHDPDDDDNLVGFIAATGVELHYAYVASAFRRHGVVPKLLDGLTIRRYTFKTLPGERRLKPRERNWAYTPRFTI